MPDTFDPYHKWLGIRPEHQPPNHYRLLGIEPFEDDPDVIVNAAQQRMAHVRTYQLGRHSALSQRILNEIAAAKACLRDSDKKAEYDQQLRRTLEAAATPPPADDSARLDLPLVGAVVAGTTILLLLFGLAVRTPDGTLVVEINEPDAVVQVLDADGKVEMTRRSEGDSLLISVDPGQHRLEVEKDGFAFFTEDFTMESGGTRRIRARLEPLPAELRPLQRYVGSWEHQVVLKPADGTAERTVGTARETCKWILEGRMIEGHAVWSPQGSRSLMLLAYDAQRQEYRHWSFDSAGSMPRAANRGRWDEATQSFNWNSTDKDGNTSQAVVRFIDKDTIEWTHARRDRTGKVLFETEGKGQRKPPPASSDVRGQEVKAPPAEMKVLERMVGIWQEEGVTNIAEGKPAATRVTCTTEISTILGGHFVLQRASDNERKVVFVTIRTFDPQQQEYRQWLFDSKGSFSELSGPWDEATNTLRLTDEGQSITPVLTIHFPDAGTMEWRLVSKDRQGKVHLDVEGKSTRWK